MMHGFWGSPGGFGWMGGIFMLIFWVLIIISIIWLVRYVVISKSCYPDRLDTSLEILKKRYAKGEIDNKEFEEKKKNLEL